MSRSLLRAATSYPTQTPRNLSVRGYWHWRNWFGSDDDDDEVGNDEIVKIGTYGKPEGNWYRKYINPYVLQDYEKLLQEAKLKTDIQKTIKEAEEAKFHNKVWAKVIENKVYITSIILGGFLAWSMSDKKLKPLQKGVNLTLKILSLSQEEVKFEVLMPGMDLDDCWYIWDVEGVILTIWGNNGKEEYHYTSPQVPKKCRHGKVRFDSLYLGYLVVSVKARGHNPHTHNSDKEEPYAKTSMLGFKSYWDSAYSKKLTNFREHGHAGEVWFGDDVMKMVATWTKGLCVDLSQKRGQNGSEDSEQGETDLAAWSVLDVGTGNGLLLQELAKQGFCDLTGTDYSVGAIDLAQSLADHDGFSSMKLLVDDILETKLDKKFHLVTDNGTLDVIGLHPLGIKRCMYWESISRLVAPGGLVVITSGNHTRFELLQEVENFNRLKARLKASTLQETEASGDTGAYTTTPMFSYLDHIRTYPRAGSLVATVAFVRS